MIKVKAKREGVRRAGVAFPKGGKTYPDDYFSKAQLDQIEDEPMLEVTHLPDLPASGPDEEAQARKVLEDMTNDKLKSECDAMGIEYPGNATKAVLVDLILKNTATPPEA